MAAALRKRRRWSFDKFCAMVVAITGMVGVPLVVASLFMLKLGWVSMDSVSIILGALLCNLLGMVGTRFLAYDQGWIHQEQFGDTLFMFTLSISAIVMLCSVVW
jgi:hypothetical protein